MLVGALMTRSFDTNIRPRTFSQQYLWVPRNLCLCLAQLYFTDPTAVHSNGDFIRMNICSPKKKNLSITKFGRRSQSLSGLPGKLASTVGWCCIAKHSHTLCNANLWDKHTLLVAQAPIKRVRLAREALPLSAQRESSATISCWTFLLPEVNIDYAMQKLFRFPRCLSAVLLATSTQHARTIRTSVALALAEGPNLCFSTHTKRKKCESQITRTNIIKNKCCLSDFLTWLKEEKLGTLSFSLIKNI